MRPSWKRCESAESFHDWFSSPRAVRRSYSTNPSPSRSPYSSIQRSAASAGLAQLLDERGVVRPPPDLGEQDEEQRRRVDGAVVAVEPVRRRLAAPHLVDDLARLGVPGRVVRGRLQRRQLAERAARELRPEQQRLQRRDQRVAPEHRHEPRHAGGRQLPRAAALAGLHLQRRQIVHRLSEGVPELVPGRLHPRHVHLPCVERLAHARTLLAEVAVDAARRTQARLPVAAGDHVDPQLPPLPRLQLHVVGDAARRRRPALGQDHLRAAEAVAVGEEVLVAVAVELRLDRFRQRLRVRRVAEREVPLLHGEDVREVGAELDPDRQLERRHRLVLQHEVVLHAVADEALAADGDRVERQRVRQRVAQEERGGEVLDGAGREEQRPLAVDRQAQPREKARVVGEQPVRRLADVAELVGDAERRAFENGELRHYGVAHDAPAGGLVARLHDDLVHVHVPRAREREEDAVGDVLRRERVDALVDGVRLLLVALEADDRELRLREARVDGRDPDRPAEQILPQRVREAAHRELRRDVRRRALVRLPAGDRAQVDDVAVLRDVRQAEPRHAHEPVHVGLEDAALVLLGRVVERRAPEREARVVDEDVDPAAELLDRLGDEGRAARRIPDVELERDLRLQPLDAPRAARDADAVLGELPRGRLPEAGRGAGDDRRPAGEVESGHGA